MILMNCLDLEDEKTGTVKSIMLPLSIEKIDILSISPMITNHGKPYKTISYLKDKHGNGYKVYGNYKDLIEKVYKNTNPIGFRKK